MNEKVISKAEGQIDEKRLYLPGLELESTCPKCKKTFTRDFGDDYLSYPEVGRPYIICLYCENCEYEYDVRVQIDVTMTILAPRKTDKKTEKKAEKVDEEE